MDEGSFGEIGETGVELKKEQCCTGLLEFFLTCCILHVDRYIVAMLNSHAIK